MNEKKRKCNQKTVAEKLEIIGKLDKKKKAEMS
jgi:hypothetical protein